MSLKKEEKHKTFDLTAETVSLCVIFSSVYLLGQFMTGLFL